MPKFRSIPPLPGRRRKIHVVREPQEAIDRMHGEDIAACRALFTYYMHQESGVEPVDIVTSLETHFANGWLIAAPTYVNGVYTPGRAILSSQGGREVYFDLLTDAAHRSSHAGLLTEQQVFQLTDLGLGATVYLSPKLMETKDSIFGIPPNTSTMFSRELVAQAQALHSGLR